MRIITIEIQNFMRFGDAQTLNLADTGLTLIEAENRDDDSVRSNGAGKSAIIDALVWCLYGKTTHQPSAEGDDVIHRDIGKDCVVRVDVEANHQEYTITRGRGCTKATQQKHKLTKTNDVCLRNVSKGTNLSLGKMSQTQQEINRVLGMTHATFQHVAVFGQSKAYRFAKLSDSERKNVLDEMLSVELYAKAAHIASAACKDIKSTLEDIRSDVARAGRDVEVHTERLKEAKKEHRRFDEVKEERIWKYQEKRLKITDKILELQETTTPDPSKIADLESMCGGMRNDDEHLTEERYMHKAATKALKERLVEQRGKLSDLKSGTCHWCGKDITSREVKEMRKALSQDIAKRKSIIEARAINLENLEDNQEELRQKMARAEKKLDKLKDQRRQAKIVKKRIAELQKDELALQEEELQAREDESPFKRVAKSERQKVKQAKDAIAAAMTACDEVQYEYALHEFWLEAFSTKGIRSLLLDSVLPTLNAHASNYADKITGGNILVEFRTQRVQKNGDLAEDFHVHVENKHGALLYSMNSIGERAKIDVIVGLALQSMAAGMSNANSNVVFFDEPFEGLDDVALDRVADMLTDVLGKRESVFVITHEEALKSAMPHSITVIKEGGFSVIEQ